MAFSLGPPGKLINFAKLGLKKTVIPINDTIAPTIIIIMFIVSILSFI